MPDISMIELREAHALIRGLRSRGSEAELTQAIASVLAADARAAAAFARIVLSAAPREGATHVAVVSDTLLCRAEHTLAEGRVDLEFSDPQRLWQLIVEIKLYAGYGHEQIQRYLRSLGAERTLVAAITRDVPTYGDLDDEPDKRWLGSVQWAKILPALRALPVADDALASQWPLFLDVLEAEGSMGFTRPDPDLFRAWAVSVYARDHMVDFVDSLRRPLLDLLRTALADEQPKARHASLAAFATVGKKQRAVHPQQGKVLVRLRVPAAGPERVSVGVWGWGEPRFVVEVAYPSGDDAAARAAIATLTEAQFKNWRNQVLSRYLVLDADLLARDTLQEEVLDFARNSFRAIVRSGVLKLRGERVTAPSDEKPQT
jgi:hypothetical protein